MNRTSESGVGSHGTGEVELGVDAVATSLPVIRAVAGNVAVGQDFDLDSIADLKLAVDEMCSALSMRAGPGSTLWCRFRPSPDEISIHAWVRMSSPELPSSSSFGWWILTTLTSSADSWLEKPDPTDGQAVGHINVSKRRVTEG